MIRIAILGNDRVYINNLKRMLVPFNDINIEIETSSYIELLKTMNGVNVILSIENLN